VAYLAATVAVSHGVADLERAQGRSAPPAVSTEVLQMHDKFVSKERFPTTESMYAEPFKLQHVLSVDLFKKRLANLRALSHQLCTRLDSAGCEGGVLITVIPKTKHVTIRDANQFRERLRMRFGLKILYIKEGHCKCEKQLPYNAHVDPYGYHLLSVCKVIGSRQKNHNCVRDTVMELARQAAFTCRPEDRSIIMSDDPTSKKRLDILIDNWEGSTSLGLDISIIDCRQQKYACMKSRIAPGAPSSDRETHKIDKYRNICQRQNALFEPFVLESHGRMGTRTRDIFDQLIQCVHVACPYLPLSYLKNYWRSRIVMAMHVSAAESVMLRNTEAGRRQNGGSCVKGVVKELPCEAVDYEMWGRSRF